MLTIPEGLSDLHYAHRVMQLFGPNVRLARLMKRCLVPWPRPMQRMDALVRLGWAVREMEDGKIVYRLDPPPLKKATPLKYRYKANVATGPSVILRRATCVEFPRVGVISDIKPGWCDERWLVEFRGKIPGGWLVRVIQRKET